ncbi:MAG: preprotein translocase subunit YajC [Clostridiales bacterium]|nr:preprotein translocase subunit YajC [Clostridiales bacterium]
MPDQYLTILWVVGIGALMYFMMIRPQRKQQKAKAAMMSSLKKGDRVVTAGGIYGIVRSVKDDKVTLEIASEVYVQFTKSAVGSILRSNESKASAPEPDTVMDSDTEDAEYVVEQDEE